MVEKLIHTYITKENVFKKVLLEEKALRPRVFGTEYFTVLFLKLYIKEFSREMITV